MLNKMIDPATGKATSRPIRFNGKCKACNERVSFLAVGWHYFKSEVCKNDFGGNTFTMVQDEHGAELEYNNGSLRKAHACPADPRRTRITMSPVIGKTVPTKECNSKCIASIGHNCECACGGKNHGAQHSC